MFLDETYESLQSTRQDFCIWVQQEHITPGTLSDGLIVGFGKANILLVGNEMNVRESLQHHRLTAVGGSVIYHDYLRVEITGSLRYRVQAIRV